MSSAPKNAKQLDRCAYAEARARGLPKSEAAKIAGSRARRVDALSKQGDRLEQEPEVEALIQEKRREVVLDIEDDFELARARARQVLEDPIYRSMWPKAWDFFAKIHGEYGPKRLEHSGGEVRTLADFVVACSQAPETTDRLQGITRGLQRFLLNGSADDRAR